MNMCPYYEVLHRARALVAGTSSPRGGTRAAKRVRVGASLAFLASCSLPIVGVPVVAWGADAGADPVVLTPKTNQVGYLPDAEKGFTIVAGGAATGGSSFEVRTSADMLAYTGQLESDTVNETAATGETVLRGDFSPLTTPGTYVVVVGGAVSRPFVIGTGVYGRLYRDAARAFDIIRSGVAIDDPVTGVTHPPSHTMDAALRDMPGVSRDLTGGWYNAGDFGKWVHMAAISTSYMMWLHELAGGVVDDVSLEIPDTVSGVPDLLTEARWGLTWMLKMQNADGSVYHKVDTEPNFCWGDGPDMDPYPRSAADPSSIDAGDFVAAMMQAARVFASVDATFAATCRAAADLSWTWLQANPNVPQPDPYYTDSDPSQEALWALAERVRATHDATLTATLASKMASTTLDPLSWQTPEILGYLSTAADSTGSAAVKVAATTAITGLGDGLLAKSAANGYSVALLSSEYWWGSAENVINRGDALLFAYTVSGYTRYRDGALHQLDWILGRNSLDRSLVSAYGQNSSVNPYHWTRYVYKILVPGWAVGGPNPNSAGVDPPLIALQQTGAPPAKCYLDLCAANGSWGSNEGQTSENAALLFAAGMLSDGTTDTAVPDPSTPYPNIGAASTDGGAAGGGGANGSGGSGASAGVGGGGASGSAAAGSSGCRCMVGGAPSQTGFIVLLTVLAALLGGRRRKDRG
jgi:endoglucanase